MSFSRVQIISVTISAAAVMAFPAATAVAKKAPKYPVVTKVTPMKVGVGDLMTISGKGSSFVVSLTSTGANCW